MRYALIGTGRISINHIIAAQNNCDELQIVAVCDLEKARMDAVLKNTGISGQVTQYTDFKKMIEEQKPDLVAIATESGLHASIGIYCLNHNCNVIIEKPIAMSIKEADDLIEAADRNGRIIAVCHQNRFNKSMQIIKKAVVENRFGKISHIAAHVRWNRNESYYNQASWRGTWADDGGCLMNQCIHNADLLCWILGDIDEVFAYTNNSQHPYIEGEDLGIALVKSKNGSYGIFEGTVNVFPQNLEETFYVFGEKGTVKADGTSVNCISKWAFSDISEDEEQEIIDLCNESPPNIYGFGHERLYRNVILALKTNTRPLIDGVEGKKALELVLAMYKSKKTGLPIKLPLDEFSSVDMTGTF